MNRKGAGSRHSSPPSPLATSLGVIINKLFCFRPLRLFSRSTGATGWTPESRNTTRSRPPLMRPPPRVAAPTQPAPAVLQQPQQQHHHSTIINKTFINKTPITTISNNSSCPTMEVHVPPVIITATVRLRHMPLTIAVTVTSVIVHNRSFVVIIAVVVVVITIITTITLITIRTIAIHRQQHLRKCPINHHSTAITPPHHNHHNISMAVAITIITINNHITNTTTKNTTIPSASISITNTT